MYGKITDAISVFLLSDVGCVADKGNNTYILVTVSLI